MEWSDFQHWRVYFVIFGSERVKWFVAFLYCPFCICFVLFCLVVTHLYCFCTCTHFYCICHSSRNWLKAIYFADLLGFNAIFNNCSVISRRPVHLLMLFLVFPHQYTTQHTFKQLAAFPYRQLNSPFVKDEGRKSQWLLSTVRKNVGRAGIQTHNNWINSPCRYRLSSRGSACLG